MLSPEVIRNNKLLWEKISSNITSTKIKLLNSMVTPQPQAATNAKTNQMSPLCEETEHPIKLIKMIKNLLTK